MPTPYVYERQVEYWTSRAIEDFYLDNGFEVLVMPLTQLTERKVPVDFLFRVPTIKKLFGFQFKVLYQNGKDHWNIDGQQHELLQGSDWMYYGLSDLKESRQHRSALHYLRVVPPAFPYQQKLSVRDTGIRGIVGGYYRWGAFYDGLHACKYGRKITTPKELQKALWPDPERAPREITRIADEVLLSDFAQRRVIRYSSLLRELPFML